MNVHIVLKYKNPRIDGETIDTVAEHSQVIKDFGYVDFGILGKGVSLERAEMLNQQRKSGHQTHLYLVGSSTTGLQTFKCSFDEITKEPKQNSKHPEYYSDLGPMTSWIRILSIEEVGKSVLSDLITISTERLALDSLSKGMASTLFVREKDLVAR